MKIFKILIIGGILLVLQVGVLRLTSKKDKQELVSVNKVLRFRTGQGVSSHESYSPKVLGKTFVSEKNGLPYINLDFISDVTEEILLDKIKVFYSKSCPNKNLEITLLARLPLKKRIPLNCFYLKEVSSVFKTKKRSLKDREKKIHHILGIHSFKGTWHYKTNLQTIKGKKQVLENLYVPKDKTLILENTKISFANHAHLFVEGRLIVKRNVSLSFKEYGGLVLYGTEGSAIDSLKIMGGKSHYVDHLPLSSSFAIWNSNLNIKNLKILNSHGDDSLHLKNSIVSIENLMIVNSKGDGIDLDNSKSEIVSMYIDRALDGIDLYSSSLYSKNVRVTRASDKGLSIGEKSYVKISHLNVESSKYGVTNKDESKLYVKRVKFRNNRENINAYYLSPTFKYDGITTIDESI